MKRQNQTYIIANELHPYEDDTTVRGADLIGELTTTASPESVREVIDTLRQQFRLTRHGFEERQPEQQRPAQTTEADEDALVAAGAVGAVLRSVDLAALSEGGKSRVINRMLRERINVQHIKGTSISPSYAQANSAIRQMLERANANRMETRAASAYASRRATIPRTGIVRSQYAYPY